MRRAGASDGRDPGAPREPVDDAERVAADLVDGAALARELTWGSPPVVLDVRWTLAGGADPAGYRDGHIPGARFVDLDAELSGPPGRRGRHPLPEPDDLVGCWRRAGIRDRDRVVVHDAADGSAAVRCWWLLRWSGIASVRVLDGGLGRWPGALERGMAVCAASDLTITPGGMPVVDVDEAAARARVGALLDARAASRFRGDANPIDAVPGHIPGALSLPYVDLYDQGRLRPAAELRARFRAAGVATAGPMVAASCGSGVTACHLVLAGRIAGLAIALYPGSYSEWCALGRPVTREPRG